MEYTRTLSIILFASWLVQSLAAGSRMDEVGTFLQDQANHCIKDRRSQIPVRLLVDDAHIRLILPSPLTSEFCTKNGYR